MWFGWIVYVVILLNVKMENNFFRFKKKRFEKRILEVWILFYLEEILGK